MNITFHGAAGAVTGSNFLLETHNKKILVDCGMYQGGPDLRDKNFVDFTYDAKEIDAVFITHAHIDHIGRLPKLVKDGYKGPIYATQATIDLAALMLADSAMLLGKEAEKLKRIPIYEPKDLKPTLAMMKPIDYHGEIELFGGKTKATLYDAGHVLGSAMVVFETEGETILFTGDLGNSPSPILRDTEIIPKDITYMVIETVYGDRLHAEREERREKIAQIYRATVEKSGVLLVPVFSLERTQDFLFELNDLIESNQVPKIPVFLDSPLAIKATQIFRKHKHLLNQDVQDHLRRGDDVFDFPGLSLTQTVQESKDINTVSPPKIILAASGMSSGGRVIHHEVQLLSDPNNTILFIGYQGVGTLGRRIMDGDSSVRIFGKDFAVNASVEKISGYSGHRDKDGLAKFVEDHSKSLKKVFTAMGEFTSSTHFAQHIRDYQGISVHVPEEGEVVEL